MSEERLRRFFVKDQRGFRVRRELREMVLFAVHDLLKDAPFSRMDLVSCRNLLIYLNRDAQRRAFDTFHFALQPEGLLFLGSSEAVEDGSPLFRVLDKKHRIYAHQPARRVGLPVPAGPGTLSRTVAAREASSAVPVVHGKRFVQESAVPFHPHIGPNLDRAALADLHLRLIERVSPPSVVINAEHEIVHLSSQATEFLKFAGGEPTLNLLRVAHPMLRVPPRTALFRAAESKQPVDSPGVVVDLEGGSCRVDVRVAPANENLPGLPAGRL